MNIDKTAKTNNVSGKFKLDDALDETQFGKFNFGLIITSGLILASIFIETVGIGYVLPVSQCDVKLTTSEKGLVNSIGFIGIIVSSHFWGFLADTIGRRKVMAPALFLAFIFAVISSFYINFWMLIVFRFLNCFFISAGSATIYAYIGEFHTDKFRSRAIMLASVIFGVGTLSLPLLTWLVLNGNWFINIDFMHMIYKPWRFLIIVFALPDLICSICLWILPESPKFLCSIGRDDEALRVLKSIFRINTGKYEIEYPVNSIDLTDEVIEENDKFIKSNAIVKILHTIWKQTAPLFYKKYFYSTFFGSLMQFIIFFTMQGLYVWFPYIFNSLYEFRQMNPNNSTSICQIMYAKEREFILGGIEEKSEFKCQEKFEIYTYIASIILEILYIVGFGIIAYLINKLGKIYILYSILSLCGICGVLCNFITSPIVAGYLYVILLAIGIVVPVVNAAIIDVYPTNLRAMAVCITLMFGRLGSVVGSNVVGMLLDVNCEMAFYISGGSLIAAAFLGLFIPKKH